MSRLYLSIAGIIGAAIGLMTLLAPVTFYASYGIDPSGQVSLLNELRSHGLALFGAGAFIAAGAFVERFTAASLLVSTALYLSYGTARLVGMALDGLPGSGLILACAAEMALGLFGLALLLRARKPALA